MLKISAYFCLSVILLLLSQCEIAQCLQKLAPSKIKAKNSNNAASLPFQQRSEDDEGKSKGPVGWFSSWKSKLMNSVGVPVPDSANRYHIRIRDLNSLQSRHVSLGSIFLNLCASHGEFRYDLISTFLRRSWRVLCAIFQILRGKLQQILWRLLSSMISLSSVSWIAW